jgi:hypothetical protein
MEAMLKSLLALWTRLISYFCPKPLPKSNMNVSAVVVLQRSVERRFCERGKAGCRSNCGCHDTVYHRYCFRRAQLRRRINGL